MATPSCVWEGEGSTVLLRPALRSTASPQTVLRRTIDPSPSIVFSGAERRPPGLWGGFCGWVGQRSGPYVGFRCKHTYDSLKSRNAGGDPSEVVFLEPNTARPGLGGFGAVVGMTLPPKPSTHLAAVGCPPGQADVKRGSRSRGGQSAAEGGRAKRWPERDRESLFHPRARRGPRTRRPR